MSEPEPTGLVEYKGAPRSMQIGGVYLAPGEEYDLPLSTVARYGGMFKILDDPVAADNAPRPGQPIPLSARKGPAGKKKGTGSRKAPGKKKTTRKTSRRAPTKGKGGSDR